MVSQCFLLFVLFFSVGGANLLFDDEMLECENDVIAGGGSSRFGLPLALIIGNDRVKAADFIDVETFNLARVDGRPVNKTLGDESIIFDWGTSSSLEVSRHFSFHNLSLGLHFRRGPGQF